MKRIDFIKNLVLGMIGLLSIDFNNGNNRSLTKTNLYTKLLTINIAGFNYYDGLKIENLLNKDDSIILKREINNKYDNKAIEVYYGIYKLGYIPRRHNNILSKLMDSNKKLIAKIRHINKYESYWNRVYIGIYLL